MDRYRRKILPNQVSTLSIKELGRNLSLVLLNGKEVEIGQVGAGDRTWNVEQWTSSHGCGHCCFSGS